MNVLAAEGGYQVFKLGSTEWGLLVFSAIMVTARAGSAMAAELGNMRVTEQIDAIARDVAVSADCMGQAFHQPEGGPDPEVARLKGLLERDFDVPFIGMVAGAAMSYKQVINPPDFGSMVWSAPDATLRSTRVMPPALSINTQPRLEGAGTGDALLRGTRYVPALIRAGRSPSGAASARGSAPRR